MSRVIPVLVGSALVLACIVSPIVLAVRQQAKTRNFRVVRSGVLYRSGQMTAEGLRGILNDYHIKTVINLRHPRADKNANEEAFCKSEDVTFVRIEPSRWGDDGGSVPVEEGVRRFREILSDPRNHPVLVHCYAGIHRAGSYSAIYRMEFEHWSNARAIAEMKSCGYANLDEELDILSFMEQYRPTWMPPIKTETRQPAPAAVKEKKKSTKHTNNANKRQKTSKKQSALIAVGR